MFSRDCDYCGVPEERLFEDSYTGMNLCVSCLLPILPDLSLSPDTEGDNLKELLDGEEELIDD